MEKELSQWKNGVAPFVGNPWPIYMCQTNKYQVKYEKYWEAKNRSTGYKYGFIPIILLDNTCMVIEGDGREEPYKISRFVSE